jgi:hypothetical protein
MKFRSETFDNAWTMFRDGTFSTFGESLKGAWDRYRLVRELKKGEARFSFVKATGEVRNAVGTLNESLFTYERKTDKDYFLAKVVKYWDLEKESFRAVRIDRLVNHLK